MQRVWRNWSFRYLGYSGYALALVGTLGILTVPDLLLTEAVVGLLLCAATALASWRCYLHPALTAQAGVVTIRNPLGVQHLPMNEIIQVVGGRMLTITAADREQHDVWCVQGANAAITSGRTSFADRVAAELRELVALAKLPPVALEDLLLTTTPEDRARALHVFVWQQREQGITLSALGDTLNRAGVPAPPGSAHWSTASLLAVFGSPWPQFTSA